MKRFLFFTIIFILGLTLMACQNQSIMQTKQIKVNEQLLNAYVAETVGQMVQGLGGRLNLSENEGMLFQYPDYQIRYFHMKGMNFSLDIIWIKDDIIVGMEEAVSVLTNGEITRVQSNQPVSQVLEVNNGWVKRHQVKIGDKVELLREF